MAKTAMSQLENQIEVIRREAYEAGYAAAIQAIREIASRPAPTENRPIPTAPAQRGRPPRQPQPAPRKAQARQTHADSKPAAKRLERGSNARFVEEVLRALANAAKLTLHLRVEAGTNAHHMIEAAFKAFARALRQAVAIDPTETGVPSTKGTLTQ